MLSYGDPFVRLQQELEQMLSGTFSTPASGVYPAMNVFDAGDEVVLKAELPGVDPAKLEVDVRDATVTLSGERTLEDSAQNGGYHRRERAQGEFRRVIRLPVRLEGGEAKAEYKHGVLSVRIPKAKEVRPRRVPIEAA